MERERMKIAAVLTCHNRREKTEQCIQTLASGNKACDITFVVVDDGSTDGTGHRLTELAEDYDIRIIYGNGNLFYSRSMRLGMEYVLKHLQNKYDYLLLLNDDVKFFEHCLDKLCEQSRRMDGAVIVGATQDQYGNMSYSAVKYTRGVHYRKLEIEEYFQQADTFNANCVLIPYKSFEQAGVMDAYYIHSLGDFDFGLMLKKYGNRIFTSKEYVGICDNNSIEGTWLDPSLGRWKRFQRKESVKGAPWKQWFYFLRKHWGIGTAIWGSVTPYIRILLGR